MVHLEPLRLLLSDLDSCSSDLASTLTAGRIKKLDTIVDKLRRPNMAGDLKTMYDIAGCRAVVPSLEELDELHRRMARLPACDAAQRARRDYISHPRASGYRGYHLIFKYDSSSQSGLRLSAELQLRTQLQHAWATAVEMYDLAVGTRLKFDGALSDEGMFFWQASQLIRAIEEDDGTSFDRRAIAGELSRLEDRTGVLRTLETCSQSVSLINMDHGASTGYYLVDIDLEEQALSIETVPVDQAVSRYYACESDSSRLHNVVLVKGSSVEQLSKLYPNYFGDISVFIELVREECRIV